jgi:hypothetical protein
MTDRSLRRRHRSALGILATLGLLGAVVAVLPATAAGARVTRGDFNEFSANTNLDIGGHAVMVRTADGRTIVTVHVTGLDAGVTYGSHVHKQACGTGFAGTHYQFVPSTTFVPPPNEIWPGPFTANASGIGNSDTIAEGTAGSTAVSVVVHGPGGTKIACADLQ